MNERIEKYLENLENELVNGQKKIVQISSEWAKTFPEKAGVYFVREEGKICYCGESENIKKRMRDLLDTRNHTLRRKVGSLKFSEFDDFEKASASKKFPEQIEKELNSVFEDNFEISAIPVEIGRKELEERIIEKYKPIYNTRERRKINKPEKAYSIAEIRKERGNAYKPWTDEEEEEMMMLHNEGKTAKEIAEILDRKRGAISSRLRKIRERKKNSS